MIELVQTLNKPPLMPPNLFEFEMLRQIADQSDVSQRGLAARLGVSVGKVNYCLRALAGKGWVKANNFRRSDNKLAYAYLLTPAGIKAKAVLTRSFLGQKLAQFEDLQREIEALQHEAGATPPTEAPTVGRIDDPKQPPPIRDRGQA